MHENNSSTQSLYSHEKLIILVGNMHLYTLCPKYLQNSEQWCKKSCIYQTSGLTEEQFKTIIPPLPRFKREENKIFLELYILTG